MFIFQFHLKINLSIVFAGIRKNLSDIYFVTALGVQSAAPPDINVHHLSTSVAHRVLQILSVIEML